MSSLLETPVSVAAREPSRPELEAVFRMKYGDPATTGWGPRLRLRHGYFTPDDVYEAVVARLVTPGCRWLDVGCGRDLFPNNVPLAEELSGRAGHLAGVDPSANVLENPLVHEKVQAAVEDYRSDVPFDLVTLRMVAEHVTSPDRAAAALARLTRPGGTVVVYTVNRRTPVALAAWLVPFRLHHAVKRWLWGTEEQDTFPVAYKMNTRAALAATLAAHGLRETQFDYLDDCRTTARFYLPQVAELWTRTACRMVGLAYPENCLLGLYKRERA